MAIVNSLISTTDTTLITVPAGKKYAMTTILVLIIAGTLAGFIPAQRAAHIKPIEALRDE